ncbi:unnamed protein product [Rotaria sp. Silwood1]|nr:unnamed protein product [Rotaria sp. Silwood1]
MVIKKMRNIKGFDDTWFSLMMCNSLLSLVSAYVQKKDYLYQKLTNAPNFNKIQMVVLLKKILNNHPCFAARGNAFILLAAMNQPDHQVIINVLSTLLDENVVKKYTAIEILLIHLSPSEFIDDLLELLKNESAIIAYEILKIFTELALNEKIDINGKLKIINNVANGIRKLKSKKPINYYYTDIKIPFTQPWIKIQGLSGKVQYSINIEESKK